MDAQRFDTLTKTLADRLSRRTALRRGGAAAAASLLAATGLQAAPALAQATQPVYTMIRRYRPSGPPSAIREALLRGYIADACQAPGFVAYFAVEDEDGDFATVAVFRSQADFENFANAEANWIAQNLGDLLPAPEEAVSGATHVHSGNPQAFNATCPAGTGATAATTAAVPTNAPGAPTTVPVTATASPRCTGQGCACMTGTQAPCDAGLICCPTTDIMGGPGICQTEAICYPHSCPGNGDACPPTCSWGDACPGCCSGYCDNSGQCANPPAPCTGVGCGCTDGPDAACDRGLICCGTTGTPNGPGTCLTETDCHPVCTGEGCYCSIDDPNACAPGLVCCPVQSGYICASVADCGGPVQCTGEGCTCDWRSPRPCDGGLVCCLLDSQGDFTCATEAACGGAPPEPPVCEGVGCCTGIGCFCDPGNPATCDPGLGCCAVADGFTCNPDPTCGAGPAPEPEPVCDGEGCPCDLGNPNACAPGLDCCLPNSQGDAVCVPAGTCGG